MIVSVQQLINTLEQISGSIKQHSRGLRDSLAPSVKGSPAEDALLNVAADLDRYPDQLKEAVDFIRDWNSRQHTPLP